MLGSLLEGGVQGHKGVRMPGQEPMESGGTHLAGVFLEIQMQRLGLWVHVGFGVSAHVGMAMV